MPLPRFLIVTCGFKVNFAAISSSIPRHRETHFAYSAAVFSFPISAKAFAALGMLACTACVGVTSRSDDADPPQVFYTVTAEIALSRHEARVAALEYAAAAATTADVDLLRG